MIGFNEGEFTQTEDITIPADAFGANRGYGAFDFLGVINRKPFYLNRHIDRFYNTLKLLGLKVNYTSTKLESIILEIVKKNEEVNYFIKLLAYPINPIIDIELKAELFIVPVVMESDSSFNYEKGIKIISKEYQRFLPEAKSTNYLPLVYWRNEIIKAKAVDVLYYSENYIRETSRGNVFLVTNGEVVTPNEKMLKGISRSIVIDILKENNLPVEERSITIGDLYQADEVFLSSTTKKILPVTQIDDKRIGEGRVGNLTKQITKYFSDIQNNWG